MQRIIRVLVASALVAAFALVATGCFGGQPSAQDEARRANDNYMSQVNSIMVELGESLEAFNGAVSRDDVVNMRTQAANASKVLDKLDALEPPAAIKDIHENYVEGAGKLREALDAYVSLYADTKAAGQSSSFSQSSYNKKLAEVQALYDEGVAALAKADEMAASR